MDRLYMPRVGPHFKSPAKQLKFIFFSFVCYKQSIDRKLNFPSFLVITGAHSVGVAHCGTVASRLTSTQDATLDPKYAASLKSQCPPQTTNVLNLDPTTPTKLDEVYYKNLQAKKGLLKSDQNLQEDAETRTLVAAHTQFSTFGPKFAQAMIAMGNVNVLTGTAGQIRLNCRRFN